MTKRPYIGVLKEKITLLQTATGKTSSGATTDVDTVYKTCFANVEDISTKEHEDGSVYYLTTTRFVIRYDKNLRGDVAEKLKVLWLGVKYNITACLELVPKQYMVLNAIKDKE